MVCGRTWPSQSGISYVHIANSPWWGTWITVSWLCALCKPLLPLVVRYIKLKYSWSVHPARRVIVYQLSSAMQSTKVLREPIQTNEKKVKNFFHASRGSTVNTCLYALPSAVTVPVQNCFIRACTLRAPPFNIPGSAPAVQHRNAKCVCMQTVHCGLACSKHHSRLQWTSYGMHF